MKEHYTESIFTLHGTNRNRVRSIISGVLLNLPIALSLWYESQKYLLVTLMVFNLHRKERQTVMKYLVCLVSQSDQFLWLWKSKHSPMKSLVLSVQFYDHRFWMQVATFNSTIKRQSIYNKVKVIYARTLIVRSCRVVFLLVTYFRHF